MNKLDSHISALLLHNDCVIIPGFGGFMAHHVDAYYDESEHLFIPPRRTLGFNSQLTMNDSLLVQAYAEAEDISYPEALRQIEQEVDLMNQQLETTGSYSFYGIGHLEMAEDSKRIFTPLEAGILTPDYYGFGLIESDILMSLLEDVAQEKQNQAQKANLIEDSDDTESHTKRISIKVSTLRTVAAACVALVLFFTLPSGFSNKITQTDNHAINTAALQLLTDKNTTSVSSLTDKILSVASQSDETAATGKVTITEKEAEAQTETQPCYYYSLVLASRVSKNNAEEFVQRLSKKGYNSARVEIHTSRKVLYGVFQTEADAYNKLRQLNSIDEFKDAWVLKLRD